MLLALILIPLTALAPMPEPAPFSSSETPDPPGSPRLVAGRYRAWLDSPGGELPFELELVQAVDGAWRGWLINGAERAAIGAVSFEEGELMLRFDPYDSVVRARVDASSGRIDGKWTRYRGPGRETEMDFHALPGQAPRFEPAGVFEPDSPFSISGRWRVQFAKDDHHSVGLFELRPNAIVHGTFLTTLGDYRYLAGIFDGKDLSLSCFDGAHAFLFEAELQEDHTLVGHFWSRAAWHEAWTAQADPEVAMPDPFGLTRYEGGVPLDKLAFPDTSGKRRTLGDPEFAGKARLIVLFGTWCPNCNDQTDYMVELHERYGDRGLSLLGLAFEFGDDMDRNARVVRAYAKHHGARYPMLVAGTSDKEAASEIFPVLDRVRAYPTTLFLDAKGGVRAVYTGFSGPATGPAHERLREGFESRIEALLAEAD